MPTLKGRVNIEQGDDAKQSSPINVVEQHSTITIPRGSTVITTQSIPAALPREVKTAIKGAAKEPVVQVITLSQPATLVLDTVVSSANLGAAQADVAMNSWYKTEIAKMTMAYSWPIVSVGIILLVCFILEHWGWFSATTSTTMKACTLIGALICMFGPIVCINLVGDESRLITWLGAGFLAFWLILRFTKYHSLTATTTTAAGTTQITKV